MTGTPSTPDDPTNGREAGDSGQSTPIDRPYRVDVTITAPVHDTERSALVADAIRNLFPECTVEERDDAVHATTHRLERLAERIRERRIGEAVRSRCHETLQGDTFELRFRKGPATVGEVNLAVDEAELGDITVAVTVYDPAPETLIDALSGPAGGGDDATGPSP